MGGNIIRRAERRTDNFTIIQNEIINNFDLSYKARAILIYILAKPKDWIVYITDLSQGMNDKEKSVRAGINELIKFKYMQRIRVYDADTKKIIRWETLVSEVPFEDDTLIDRVIEKYHRDSNGDIINVKQNIRGKIVDAPFLLERKEALLKDKVQNVETIENSTFELLSQNVQVDNVQVEKDALQSTYITKYLYNKVLTSSSGEEKKKEEEDIISYAESIDLKITKKIIRDLLKLHNKTNILKAIELTSGRELKNVKAYLISVLKDIEGTSIKNINIVNPDPRNNNIKNNSNFNNFEQRNYDYDELEKKLLGRH